MLWPQEVVSKGTVGGRDWGLGLRTYLHFSSKTGSATPLLPSGHCLMHLLGRGTLTDRTHHAELCSCHRATFKTQKPPCYSVSQPVTIAPRWALPSEASYKPSLILCVLPWWKGCETRGLVSYCLRTVLTLCLSLEPHALCSRLQVPETALGLLHPLESAFPQGLQYLSST